MEETSEIEQAMVLWVNPKCVNILIGALEFDRKYRDAQIEALAARAMGADEEETVEIFASLTDDLDKMQRSGMITDTLDDVSDERIGALMAYLQDEGSFDSMHEHDTIHWPNAVAEEIIKCQCGIKCEGNKDNINSMISERIGRGWD